MPELAHALRSKALLFAAIAFSATIPNAAHSILSNNSSAEKTTVTGTVINSETREPIPGALVCLDQSATLTDDKGNFSFQTVPRLTAFLIARKPGYLDSQRITKFHNRPRFINIAPGMQPITVEIIPEGIIFGEVTSADGEPLEDIPITLFSSIVDDGRKSLLTQGGGSTDDQGRFRIANLMSGTYYLSAGPSNIVDPAAASPSAATAQGYSMVYYPSGQEFASAIPIAIGPGKHFEVHLTLNRQPFYRISGTLSGLDPGQNVSVQFQGSSMQLGSASIANSRTGVFRSTPLPAGPYTVRATVVNTYGNRAGPQAFTTHADVNLNASTLALQLAMMPPRIITFNLVMDSTSPPIDPSSRPLIPVLYPVDPEPGRGFNRGIYSMGDKSAQKYPFPDLDPGRYQIEFQSGGAMFYAASATFGNIDLLRDDLVIGSDTSSQTIDVHVRDDGGIMKVSVSSSGDKSEIAVFVVSEEFPGNVQTIFPDPDGAAFFGGLAPGAYRVFALDNPDNLEYRRPGALDDFLSRAAEVTVSPKQQASVTVNVLHREN
jgi:hypothetical protein